MRMGRGWLGAAAGSTMIILACSDGDGGPTAPRFPNIHGSWVLQGTPNLVLDSCGLDEIVDVEGELADVIAETDNALDFSQDDDEIVLHGVQDLEGTISTSGVFQTEDLVGVEQGVTTRAHVEGEINGTRMTGKIFLSITEGITTCNLEFTFQANRVSTTPNTGHSLLESLSRPEGLAIPLP